MTVPLSTEAEATMRERHWALPSRGGSADIEALLATLDTLRASLDPDNEAAVEAWARYGMTAIGETWEPNQADLDEACALLRARAKAERR